jgi:signal peptidase I
MSDPGSSPAPEQIPPAQNPPRPLPVIAVWARDLLVSLAISAFIIIFLYQPVKVEGTSMMPGLEDQERIFVNKFVYRWEPIQRGDIVVFRYPRDTTKSYIKRVIGTAGDRIRIENGQVFVNDEALDEDNERYIYGKAVFGYWPMEKLGRLR